MSLTAFWPACLAKKCLNVMRQSLAAVAPTGKWLDKQAVLRASMIEGYLVGEKRNWWAEPTLPGYLLR